MCVFECYSPGGKSVHLISALAISWGPRGLSLKSSAQGTVYDRVSGRGEGATVAGDHREQVSC